MWDGILDGEVVSVCGLWENGVQEGGVGRVGCGRMECRRY